MGGCQEIKGTAQSDFSTFHGGQCFASCCCTYYMACTVLMCVRACVCVCVCVLCVCACVCVCVLFQVVFSKFEDLLPKHLTEEDPELQLATEEEMEEVCFNAGHTLTTQLGFRPFSIAPSMCSGTSDAISSAAKKSQGSCEPVATASTW